MNILIKYPFLCHPGDENWLMKNWLASMAASDQACYTLINVQNDLEPPSEMQLRNDLEKGDTKTKIDALKRNNTDDSKRRETARCSDDYHSFCYAGLRPYYQETAPGVLPV